MSTNFLSYFTWYVAGSSAQSDVVMADIGASGGISTTAWELAIFAPNGVANTYYMQLTNLTTEKTATYQANGGSAVVPQSTTLLSWGNWSCNNSSTTAVGIDLSSLYIETDY